MNPPQDRHPADHTEPEDRTLEAAAEGRSSARNERDRRSLLPAAVELIHPLPEGTHAPLPRRIPRLAPPTDILG